MISRQCTPFLGQVCPVGIVMSRPWLQTCDIHHGSLIADRRVSSRLIVVVHPFRHDGPEFLNRLGVEKQRPVLSLEALGRGYTGQASFSCPR